MDEYLEGIMNKNNLGEKLDAGELKFQKTNPLARGDENIKPLEVYAEHAEIRKQVYGEIKKLYVTLQCGLPAINITIDRFLGCLTPLKNLHDPGRLPVYMTVPRSVTPDKLSCVWAIVSCLVQAYWEYELDSGMWTRTGVLLHLEELEEINKHYPEMKITGAENKGYWLEL